MIIKNATAKRRFLIAKRKMHKNYNAVCVKEGEFALKSVCRAKDYFALSASQSELIEKNCAQRDTYIKKFITL